MPQLPPASRPGAPRRAALLTASGQGRIEVEADLFHELTNMLVVVLGSLELLERRLLDQEARRQLDRAQHSAERAGELARQAFAEAQGGHARGNADVAASALPLAEAKQALVP